ncbi:MAG: hypothetical protein ACXWG1_14165 [Usitatibacter sp.]
MKRLVAITLFSATSALAGPFDQVYSIIETDTAPTANPHLLPVIVNRVDDENSMGNRSVVPPGPHKVVLDVPPRRGFRATQQTMDLGTKPCTRYYVGAELKSPALQEWTPVIRREEPIGECRKKFGLG